LDLQINPGTVTAVLGSSGVGKSSMLNSIRGDLDYIGAMSFYGKVFTVFQDLNQMFPWYTMRQNLDLAIGDNRYLELCSAWKITELLDHYPGQLSGGQRQRFTLIRACCSDTKYLLCDEVLNGLDTLTGSIVVEDLRQWVVNNDIGCIFVTHNWHEARNIADQIVVIKKDIIHYLTPDFTDAQLYSLLV
jgi:ABC-type nitrate/sulfonate/bicarbonate transport system ATPase subunit